MTRHDIAITDPHELLSHLALAHLGEVHRAVPRIQRLQRAGCAEAVALHLDALEAAAVEVARLQLHLEIGRGWRQGLERLGLRAAER